MKFMSILVCGVAVLCCGCGGVDSEMQYVTPSENPSEVIPRTSTDYEVQNFWDDRMFVTTIDNSVLKNTPRWIDDEENPPVSIRRAIDLAGAYRGLRAMNRCFLNAKAIPRKSNSLHVSSENG